MPANQVSLNLNIWSLFSGIGGLEKGLEDARIGQTVFQVENDPFALSILTKHWPKVPKFKDVKFVENKGFCVGLPQPDLICGGFPCQPHSLAGQRKGASDDRHLWPEFARIIKEFKPRFVVAENVPGIRTNGALLEVLTDLTNCGYDAEWIRLGAAAVGAPHLRERIFIVAYSRSAGRRENSDAAFGDEGPNGRKQDKDHVSDGVRLGDNSGSSPEPFIFTDAQRARLPINPDNTIWKSEPNVGRVATGISKRVDRLKVLGNAVVPQVAEFIGSCIYDAIKEDS